MKTLWVEQYRPKHVQDYVWKDAKQQQIVQSWIAEKNIPHILLSGIAGTGKSSCINVLLHELDINPNDVFQINASEETSVETVRTKILNFASTIPFGDFKVCVLEEADALSKAAQRSLKRVIEDYTDNCRFIFTTNEPHRIDPALHSRLQQFHFEALDEESFIARMMYILEDNNVAYDADVLIAYVKAAYPDLRKAIGLLEQNSHGGTLMSPSSDNTSSIDYMVKVAELFQKGKIQEAREVLTKQSTPEEYIEIYRFLYRNLSFWGNTNDKQDQALIIIRDGLYKDSLVADREINLSATLAQLAMME